MAVWLSVYYLFCGMAQVSDKRQGSSGTCQCREKCGTFNLYLRYLFPASYPRGKPSHIESLICHFSSERNNFLRILVIYFE